jgi:hypothetical protein
MLDVEPVIVEELRALSPLDLEQHGDWAAIVAAAAPARRRRRTMAIRVGLVLAAIIAVTLPTVAFSAGVRSLLGFNPPTPKFNEAHLRTTAPLPGGRVARLWTAPSTQGGECWFVTYARAGSPVHPTRRTSGGWCTVGRARIRGPWTWSLSHGSSIPSVLAGRVDPKFRATRVVLRWYGGATVLRVKGGYFVVSGAVLNSPPFTRLPFDLIAENAAGKTVASSRIPTSFLYSKWKNVEPELRHYRRAHDCRTTGDVWRCRSR